MGDAVHKDFHGALSYGLAFLEGRWGLEGVRAFLAEAGPIVYRHVIEDLRARGLPALEQWWRQVFAAEGGEIAMHYEGDVLVLRVHRCPAIHHMKERAYAIAPHFCEHTRFVNEAVCAAAGYAASVTYDQDAGQCVQRFWKPA